MRKRLAKWVWWLPVINAGVVGLILWLVNGMSLRAVWTDEALIAAVCLVYLVAVLRLPIDAEADKSESSSTEDPDNVTYATIITDLNNPPVKPKPFLGHRYPAGARRDSAAD